jgi:hypothetical protein
LIILRKRVSSGFRDRGLFEVIFFLFVEIILK